MKTLVTIAALAVLGCNKSSSKFQSKEDKVRQTPSDSETTVPKETEDADPDKKPEPKSSTGEGTLDTANDLSKCWFAVSGAYFGLGYNSTFPLTLSGKPISHGETFDTAGGIYLNASDQPYLAPTTAKENSCATDEGTHDIEEAVCRTFDSIAVAPGMQVEIKGSNGAVLLNQKGPYMGVSAENGGTVDNVSEFLRGLSEKMPKWMVDYLTSTNYKLDRRNLWDARSVKVTRLSESSCE
ncbi:MAG: hypothetical protein AB7T49_17170 [Oligoflexales bacterium]